MGDCLFATVIARQIKEIDYPNCHLTWAVNSKCVQAVLHNPYVDEIWEISTEHALTSPEEWNSFVAEAERKRANGEFDYIFLTQIFGENWLNYDGGIRSSTYNNYPHEITVPHAPVFRLSEAEIENVRRYAAKHRLAEYKRVILVEHAPNSFETALNPQSAYEMALQMTGEDQETAVILSSNKRVASTRPSVIDASELSFRENAELTKYCDLFIGCASGISWLTTTDWAKKMKTILVINEDKPPFPSMIYDHEYFNLPIDHIIEIRSDGDSLVKLKNCADAIKTDGFAAARKIFNEKIELTDYSFLSHQFAAALSQMSFGKFYSCLRRSVERNGARLLLTPQFLKIVWNLQLVGINKLLKITGLKKDRISQST